MDGTTIIGLVMAVVLIVTAVGVMHICANHDKAMVNIVNLLTKQGENQGSYGANGVRNVIPGPGYKEHERHGHVATTTE